MVTGELLRLLGGGLLVLAGALFGWERCAVLRRRRDCLRSLCTALGQAEGELTSLCTPLPELFARLDDCPMFRLVSAAFGTEPLDRLWRRAAAEMPISREEQETLASLGGVLGRCDAERQAGEIRLVRQRLTEYAAAVEREIALRGRRFPGLGAAAGAILAVMLF